MNTDADYLRFDPFEGEEADIACKTVAIKRARKKHPCFLGAGPQGDHHTIKPGERYRSEKALIDGSFWGRSAICLPCIDKFLADVLGSTGEPL
ncbi:hypothetical protein [Polaromonas hydrogenivorans]|uniref:Uncharacterized protein n=1 Tax=Polaromonas hydrogenivorans TaxID=335476 RepID=A0AAU7LWE3_9BURK